MVKNLEELFIQSKNPSIVWITAKFIEDKIGGQYYSTDYIEYERILNTNKLTVLKDVVFEYNGGPMGFQLHSYDYVDQGVPVLRTKDMKELTIILDDPIFILREKHNELKGSKTYSGDIIISKTGQIGVVAVVPKTISEANLNQALCNIRVKESVIDNYFLVVFLNSKYGQYQFIRQGEGKAVQNGLTKDEILDLRIPVISSEIQKCIGDKVRKAEELREEAKRLKKEAEELFNQNYGQITINDSKFEWVNSYYLNEDNVIPNFYKQYQLLRDKRYAYIEFVNIVESIKCGVPVRSDMRIGNTYPFYGASGVTDNIGNYNFNGEYLIIAQDGSIGSVNVARNKFWANNHVWVVQVKEGWDLEFLELYLGKYNYWISLTTGSVVPKVTSENLKKLLVPKINYEVQKSIGDKIREAKHKEQKSRALIEQAKQDVENLIEGNFSMK